MLTEAQAGLQMTISAEIKSSTVLEIQSPCHSNQKFYQHCQAFVALNDHSCHLPRPSNVVRVRIKILQYLMALVISKNAC